MTSAGAVGNGPMMSRGLRVGVAERRLGRRGGGNERATGGMNSWGESARS